MSHNLVMKGKNMWTSTKTSAKIPGLNCCLMTIFLEKSCNTTPMTRDEIKTLFFFTNQWSCLVISNDIAAAVQAFPLPTSVYECKHANISHDCTV